MPTYRVLKSNVWKTYQAGEVVDTWKRLDFYVAEGIVEETDEDPTLLDESGPGGPRVKVGVSDVIVELVNGHGEP